MKMLSRNGVNIAGTKAFDYLLSKLKGPENAEASEEFDVESLADLEFLKDINKRQDFQNSIENLLKDFGDLDSHDGEQESGEPPAHENSDTPTRLSRRPSLHPSRDGRPSMHHLHPVVGREEDVKSPHCHLIKILEGVVHDVQKEVENKNDGNKKKRSMSKPKQRKARGREEDRDKDQIPRARRKSVGRAVERGAPSDASPAKSKSSEKARDELSHRRSAHKTAVSPDGSRRKESSASHYSHRESVREIGSRSGHRSKPKSARGNRGDSDTLSNHQPSTEGLKQSSSHHRSSSQHSVSSRSSSQHDSGRESQVNRKGKCRGNDSPFYSPSVQRKRGELPMRTPLQQAKGRAMKHPSSPETAVTYEFDQEESESSFACSSHCTSPTQSRGRGASSTVSRRGRSRSTSRARIHPKSRQFQQATSNSECNFVPQGDLGQEGSTLSHEFEMREENIVVTKARNARRCRSVEPSMRRSSLPSAAFCDATPEASCSVAYPGSMQVPLQSSYPARRRSSMGSTASRSTPAQRRRSIGSSSIALMPHAFPSTAHRRGSIGSASMDSVQHSAHISLDGSSLRSLPQTFPSVAHRRNSIDSLSIISMPHMYSSAAQRRTSINGGLIRSPSSMSVSSRVSNSSGFTAQSAPAHLYRSPTGWASPSGSHYSAGHQVYPAIRPPPQPYPATRRGSCGGGGGGGFGAGEARRRARADPATDPFFSVSAFGHSSTDPFRAARRASLY
jgi:hypothetical protein